MKLIQLEATLPTPHRSVYSADVISGARAIRGRRDLFAVHKKGEARPVIGVHGDLFPRLVCVNHPSPASQSTVMMVNERDQFPSSAIF